MSSAGQIIGGIVGAVAGFFVGGPQGSLVGAQLGMGLGGMIDPPKGPHIVGPRLTDLTTQTSTYGAVIPRIYGTVPIVGNVFWLENNTLKETEHTQSQGKGGGGSESTTFTYSATFAVGLCEGPIQGVRRIWIGPNLIYDASAVNVATAIASSSATPFFRIYNGTDVQNPDPRMQSTLGMDNTPAYRGLAYIVFYDLPLADYQNSLVGAQVKVEVLTQGTQGYQFANVSGSLPKGRTVDVAAPYKDDSGMRMWQVSDQSNDDTITISRYLLPFQGKPRLLRSTSMRLIKMTRICRGPSDIDMLAITHTRGNGGLYLIDANFRVRTLFAAVPSGYVVQYVIHQGYAYFVAGWPRAVSLTRSDLRTGFSVNVPLRFNASAASGSYCMGVIGNKLIMSFHNNYTPYLVTYDKDTLAFIAADKFEDVFPRVSHPYRLSFSENRIFYHKTNRDFCHTDRIGGVEELIVKGTGITPSTWTDPYQVHYYPNALIGIFLSNSPFRSNVTTWVNQRNVSLVPLSSIIEAEALKSQLLTASDLDVSALTSPVRGYTISAIGAIRGGFDPLMGAWPFDIIQSGYKILCKPRGGASVVTIPVAKLDARAIGGQPGVQITNAREMDSVLPSKVALKYLDSDREYNIGEQYAERLNTHSVHVSAIDLAIVLSADEAAQKAEVLLYMYWLERYDIVFSLPPEYNYLEPSDVITITAADATYVLRLTHINYTSDGRLECHAKYNSAGVYTSNAVGGTGTSTGPALVLAGPAQYALMDIPLLKDVFDTAGFPVAMSGYFSGWPGGILMRSDDDGQVWEQIQGFSKPGATMGYASDILSAHDGLLIDKASRLSVIVNHALSSATECQMLNGANHFAYGQDGRWEIIAAQHCMLQEDGGYLLTDLLRGRFGSEWTTGLHAINDQIIMLNAASLQFVASNLNLIGVERAYRGITTGKTMDSDSSRNMTYQGVNLKCLSPVYLNGHRHPKTNDWTLTWIRRTRKGGELRDYVDAALSEASESYAIDIFTDNKYTAIKRTLAVEKPTVAYTSAEQIADFGGHQTVLYLKLYQLSAITGRGYPLTTSITR